MTVKELKEKLLDMPDGCHVYINQEEDGACSLVQSVEYCDTLAGDDDANMSDGVLISSITVV
jgi:hypothetical protein